MKTTAAVAVLCCLAGAAGAQDTATGTYPIPKHGALELRVPASWTGSPRYPRDELPPTVTFAPKSGAPFQVLVTPIPMWRAEPRSPVPGLEALKTSVRSLADASLPQAVEKSLPLTEMKGPGIAGAYFSATDKAPEPGGFKYLTQGIFSLSDFIVTFTILTNDGQVDVVKDAVSMLSNARHRNLP